MEKKHNLAKMLTDLANLHRSPAAIGRLLAKYPNFLPESGHVDHLGRALEAESGEEEMLDDLPYSIHHVWWIKEMVCQLWKGNPDPRRLRELEQILLSGEVGLNSPAPSARKSDPEPLPGIIGLDWKHRTFVYQPQTLLQQALHYLMQESPKAKICANPDCPAPYFIAPRSNARYCSEDCLQTVQRTAKRSWWEQKGQEWRASRTKASTKKGKRT